MIDEEKNIDMTSFSTETKIIRPMSGDFDR
jgi:hypothetical protein